ncbi:hypothetical protein AHMF7616_04444 [Adhaeribacter pallidiroseus]|uniref:Uncharacterized protein n=1 Tax=Adhaeribacter pallidiroseus TaxID=2072847 RepID=A0A369QM66_9BACT|nr:hypothetical protein AHMF7616_04444 [Adhaeribacter pallidiroseus]
MLPVSFSSFTDLKLDESMAIAFLPLIAPTPELAFALLIVTLTCKQIRSLFS